MGGLALGLAVSGLGCLAVLVGSARRPAAPPPDRDGYFSQWSTLHGGYDPRASMVVRRWLGWVYTLARPLARAGVSPGAVTLLGCWVAALALLPAAAGGRWPLLAAAVLVASAVLDNLDGAVAVLTGRVTAWGYVVDSLADRAADALALVALWLVGAPAGVCVGAAAAVVLLEYGRARAGSAGFAEIGVVTVGERPTRVVVAAAALAWAGLWPSYAAAAAGVGAAVTLGLCVVGSGQFLLVARRRLAP